MLLNFGDKWVTNFKKNMWAIAYVRAQMWRCVRATGLARGHERGWRSHATWPTMGHTRAAAGVHGARWGRVLWGRWRFGVVPLWGGAGHCVDGGGHTWREAVATSR